jgi:hypothetical protein
MNTLFLCITHLSHSFFYFLVSDLHHSVRCALHNGLHDHLQAFRNIMTTTGYRHTLTLSLYLPFRVPHFRLSPVTIKILFKTPKWTQFFIIYNATLQLFNNAYFENDICGRKTSICLAHSQVLYLFAFFWHSGLLLVKYFSGIWSMGS